MPIALCRRRFLEDRYRRRSLTGSTLSNHLDQRFARHGSPELNSMADRSCGAWLNIARDHRVAFLPCLGQAVHRLQVHPEFRPGAEEARQPQGRVRGHRPLTLDNRAHARGRHAQRHGERVHRKPERLQKLLGEHLGFCLTDGSNTKLKMGDAPKAFAYLAGLRAHSTGLASSHELVNRAPGGLCRKMKCKLIRAWWARGKSASRVLYFGLVLEGLPLFERA